MKDVSASVCFLSLLLSCVVLSTGFITPVPVARSRTLGNKALTEGYKSRVYERRHATMSAAKMPSSEVSGEDSAAPAPSRLSRISGHVRKMIRKAIMGYVPEEEVSYTERAAQQAAAAAKLRGEAEIADERLRGASIAAKAAAIEAVEKSVLAEDEDEDDILSSGFVQLNIGDQSPMEAEDKLASLRKRLEQGLPPDTSQEQAEKRRLAMQQQQQQKPPSSRPPSFDGDTAVAERPSSTPGAPQSNSNKDAMRPPAPKETPKLASPDDVERLNRMFGSMGGEPLR